MKLPGEDIVLRTVEAALEGKPSDHPNCLNCGEELQGDFCASCGQRSGDLHISIGEFFKEALDSLFSLDSRFWVTFSTLLRRPGFLTVEYWAGRRVRYLPPLRLYLFVSFVSFLLMSFSNSVQVLDTTGSDNALIRMNMDTGNEVNWEEDFNDTPEAVQWIVQNMVRPATEQPERVRELFFQRMPWAIFILVPFFAVQLRLLYRKVDTYLVPHLIFSLHFHTATFVYLTLGSLGDWLTGTEILSSLASLAVFATLFFGLRRAYRGGIIKTLIKEFILLIIYLIMLGLVLLATISLTLLAL